MSSRRTAIVLSGVAVVVATLAGCASGGREPLTGPTDPGAAGIYPLILKDANEVGASEEQIDQILMYYDGSDIPFDEVEIAMERVFACFDANGLKYDSRIVDSEVGFLIFDYRWAIPSGMDDEVARELGNMCVDHEATFITAMYQQQPSVVEFQDNLFEARREELLECLRGYDVVIDDDATRDEMSSASIRLLFEGRVDHPVCVVP